MSAVRHAARACAKSTPLAPKAHPVAEAVAIAASGWPPQHRTPSAAPSAPVVAVVGRHSGRLLPWIDGAPATAARYAARHGHTGIVRFLVGCAGASEADALAGAQAALLRRAARGGAAARGPRVVQLLLLALCPFSKHARARGADVLIRGE